MVPVLQSRCHRSTRWLAFLGLLLLGAIPGRGQSIIETITGWDGTSEVLSFTDPSSTTQTYGQTITIPTFQTVLTSFTFEIKLPSSVTFAGYVYAWDGAEATGPALFTSAPTNTTGSGNFEAITFNTGSLNLQAGTQYVLFASSTGLTSSAPGSGSFGFNVSNPYANGLYVFTNQTTSASWTTTAWTQNWNGPGSDLAFRATLIPEPGSFLLLGAGLGMVALLGWRRRYVSALAKR